MYQGLCEMVLRHRTMRFVVDEIEKALSGSGDTSGVSQGILGDLLYAI